MTPGQTTIRLAAAMLLLSTTCVLCCTLQPPPEPREPDVTVVYELPDGGPASCGSVAANLASLGGCGLELDQLETDCDDAARSTGELERRLPVECLSTAKTCDDAIACRVTPSTGGP